MITTIQIHEKIKKELDRLKSKNETYEEVIVGLISKVEHHQRSQRDLLIEGYQEMAEESKSIVNEWSYADLEWD